HETTCVTNADAVFLAVGTPETPTGDADVSAVFAVVEDLAAQLKKGARIVLKSTVPIGTNKRVHNALTRLGRPDVGVVSNPEF
ncbi:UDP-glucose 6-dehydrogenase, partial [bacterium NHP-B]